MLLIKESESWKLTFLDTLKIVWKLTAKLYFIWGDFANWNIPSGNYVNGRIFVHQEHQIIVALPNENYSTLFITTYVSTETPWKDSHIYLIHNSFLLLSDYIFFTNHRTRQLGSTVICPYFAWFTSGPQRAQSFHQLHITIYPTEAGWTLYGRVHMKGVEIDFWLYWSMDPLVPLWAVAFQLFLEPNKGCTKRQENPQISKSIDISRFPPRFLPKLKFSSFCFLIHWNQLPRLSLALLEVFLVDYIVIPGHVVRHYFWASPVERAIIRNRQANTKCHHFLRPKTKYCQSVDP